MVTRKLPLTKLIVLLSLATFSVNAVAESQQEIEARIRALNAELYDLHQQLQQIENPEDAALDIPFEQLPEEAAREDLSDRRELEQESTRNPFSITTHRTCSLLVTMLTKIVKVSARWLTAPPQIAWS